MKNLENFGVQELNAREIRETEGGIWPVIAICCMAYQIYHGQV
jgi:lactobin A/cerein 7B family class IIb bacteriocin